MKIRNLSSAAILCAVAISVGSLRGQSPSPEPTVAPPTTLQANALSTALATGLPVAAMTYPDSSSLIVVSKSGRFPLVVGPAGGTVNIYVCFPPNPTDNSLLVGAMDGGTVPDSQISTSVAVDGTASIQFQPDTQPGLYRVLLNQGGTMTLLQFWVFDPQQPGVGPPALQPSTPGPPKA